MLKQMWVVVKAEFGHLTWAKPGCHVDRGWKETPERRKLDVGGEMGQIWEKLRKNGRGRYCVRARRDERDSQAPP